ncbi:MAG: hypothetical protein LBJ32_02275 [Oscillospiraceae bacterium]|jgi:hypothetical protein|nr:hypothetical protein [Oscillospiraceae bacterium]
MTSINEEEDLKKIAGGSSNDLQIVRSEEGKYFAALSESFNSENELKAYIKGMDSAKKYNRYYHKNYRFNGEFKPRFPRFSQDPRGPNDFNGEIK